MTSIHSAASFRNPVIALLLCCSLLACSSKEDREAKLILHEIKTGCVNTGAPKEMCDCVVESPNLVRSAKLLAANKNDEERRLTFVSQVNTYTVSCAETVLGDKPRMELTPEAQSLMDQVIPRE